ncbi:hypothetical protein NBO_354g0001 [Nosema bombycis CQ1]|uniref:Uncharacterized protein n=1 Tax=Nosema bombycis (strain CQ1 / CVCC 102059) TaxID=578461 RepID=R0KRL5_NOSB1|nr:hypothetical protein NBO_354g0001 [Nosema bombycis CQ1]|eukprot:EOB12857.1 hypothetical protein NBO_354g0001 [Nosema bombycis CQ1]
MNFATVILVLLSNVYSTTEYVLIDTAYLVEHNFWIATEKSPDVNKKNFFVLRIKIEDIDEYTFDFNWLTKLYYHDEKEKLVYSIVSKEDYRRFSNLLQSSKKDKEYLRFEYYYIEKSYKQARLSSIGKGDTAWYKNFKILESREGNVIEMCNDQPINTLMHHVEERFRNLSANGLISLNNKFIKEWNGDFEKNPDFDLYYFKNYSDCLKDLKEFINNLNCLTFINDKSDSATVTSSDDDSHKETNIVKSSSLIEFLNRKFDEDSEVNNMELNEKENLKLFFIATYETAKRELLNKNMILPLGGQYTIDYYLKELYDLIIENARKTQETCISLIREQIDPTNSLFIITEHLDAKYKKITLQDIYDHENILKHFSDYLKKKISTVEDYVEVEKVVCDFYNMIKYLSKKFNTQFSRKNYCIFKTNLY